jgi:hypothetical protein
MRVRAKGAMDGWNRLIEASIIDDGSAKERTLFYTQMFPRKWEGSERVGVGVAHARLEPD